mgnify:CR=1 FL=1|jgi:hypothetical protein
MKLLENVIYSSIIFVFSYVIISMTLRLFNITESFTSHMVGGIVGTVLGVSLFIYLLIYKPKKK